MTVLRGNASSGPYTITTWYSQRSLPQRMPIPSIMLVKDMTIRILPRFYSPGTAGRARIKDETSTINALPRLTYAMNPSKHLNDSRFKLAALSIEAVFVHSTANECLNGCNM